MKPFFTIIILLNTFNATAAEDDFSRLFELSLEELLEIKISVASKIESNSLTAPGVVSLITKEDIIQSGARTLSDVLNTLPGFTVSSSVRAGVHPVILVRGRQSFNSDDILFLRDGHRLNDPVTGGSFTFRPDYPLTNIKQIEVIRGPGSALYGANAYLAVVNIITEEALTDGWKVSARMGTNEGKLGSLVYENVADDFKLRATMSYVNYEFNDRPVAPVTFFSTFEHQNYTTADALEISDMEIQISTEHWNVAVEKSFAQTFANWGLGVPDEVIQLNSGELLNLKDPALRSGHKGNSLGLTTTFEQQIDQSLNLKWLNTYRNQKHKINYFGVNFDLGFGLIDEGYKSSVNYEPASNFYLTDLIFDWKISKSNQFLFGVNYLHEEVDATPFLSNEEFAQPGNPFYEPGLPEVEQVIVGTVPFYETNSFLYADRRDVFAAYVQHTWNPTKDLVITSGIRFDHYSDFGSTINPRLAVVFNANEALSFKALAGSAFKAPSLIAKNFDFSSVSVANPDLQPETLESYEFQTNYQHSENLLVSATLFSFNINDRISQIPVVLVPGYSGPQDTFEAIQFNLGAESGEGAEIEIRYLPENDFSAFINYGKAKVEVDLFGTRQPVEGVPQDTLNVGVQSQWFDGRFNLNLYSSRRWNIKSQQAIVLDSGFEVFSQLDFSAYTEFNLHAEYLLGNSDISLLFDARNLTDENILLGEQHSFTPAGVTRGGRQYLLGFRWSSN